MAAIASQQPQEAAAGVPPHWNMYITVADVDDAAAKVADAGGSVHAGPFDVMDAGRMAVVQDPVGAFVMLWEPKGTAGVGLVNEDGAFIWDELIAPNAASAAPFYEAVVGLKLVQSDMGDGRMYSGWTLDGTDATMVGGAMDPPMPGIPPHWSIYFGSNDIDAHAAKTKELGGSVLSEPMDIPVGRFAVLADPQGAVFSHLLRPPTTADPSVLCQETRRLASCFLTQTRRRVGNVSVPLGRVAEWQTRWLQVPVRATSWGFKSPLAHGSSAGLPWSPPPVPSGVALPGQFELDFGLVADLDLDLQAHFVRNAH